MRDLACSCLDTARFMCTGVDVRLATGCERFLASSCTTLREHEARVQTQ